MSLKDKASKINFGPSTVQEESKVELKVKTAPGAMLSFANDQRSEMLKENESLKEKVADVEIIKSRLDSVLNDLKQWDGAKATKLIDPALISPSDWANRHVASFETTEFRDLVEEIASAGGNAQPIKVRPLASTDPQRFEIVFGHRRHKACLELGLPVLALIESIDDKALFVEMDRENRQRADLRPIEQGLMYRRALDRGLYPSLRSLCEASGANLGNSSLVLRLAKLPDVLLEAFPSKLDIQYRWIQPLLNAMEKDSDSIIAYAKEISDARVAGEVIDAAKTFERLTAEKIVKPSKPLQQILVDGKAVATVKKSKNSFTFQFEPDALTNANVKNLEAFIVKLLT